MNQKEIRSIFRQTLIDFKLSRKEKKLLDQMFENLNPNEREILLYRDIAFDLVRETSQEGSVEDALSWLDEIMKLLLQYSGDKKNKHGLKQHRDEAYFSPGQHCPQRIIRLLDQAERSVDICVFTITDDRISSAIIDAYDRKIAIRIITDNYKSEDLGSDATRLLEAGVPVRFDNSRHHMHHKFALVDGFQLLTGSYNWTRSAAEHNAENFIITQNQHFVKKFKGEFEKLWLKYDEE